MIAPRVLCRCGGRVTARLQAAPRQPSRTTGTLPGGLSRHAWNTHKSGASVRSFGTSRVALFKSDAASDHPGEDFTFALSESQGDKVKHPKPAVASAAPFSKDANELAEHFGFLFDCDGVLHQGSQKVDSAKVALRLCHHQATRYLFLTNGGGNTTEDEKAASLLKKVGMNDADLVEGRVIQSHTPLSTFKAESMLHQTVYITSLDPDRARDIAHMYGFKKVVTAADVLDHYGDIYPFEPKMIGQATAQPLPDGAKIWNGSNPMDYDDAELDSGNYLKIDQIFVLNDPRDWSVETQIIHDILISHRGYLGTVSTKNGVRSLENDGWQQDQQPRMWLSNLDLLWKTEHPISRFGTGAFVHAFRGVWEESTGRELQFKYMGKPSQITYEYAHGALKGDRPLRRVYMVGDNPESDIRGALEFHPEDGTEYVPILVRTGVWQETKAESQPRFQPAVIVDDVLDAVVWAMRQEGVDVDRDMIMQNKAGVDLLH